MHQSSVSARYDIATVWNMADVALETYAVDVEGPACALASVEVEALAFAGAMCQIGTLSGSCRSLFTFSANSASRLPSASYQKSQDAADCQT